jgi:hypothetical protein
LGVRFGGGEISMLEEMALMGCARMGKTVKEAFGKLKAI